MARKKKEITIIWKLGDIWTSADKTIFRKTKDWINFRNKMTKLRGKCELCGYEKRLHVHHIHMNDSAESYTDLREERFKVLDSRCHKYLHTLWTSYKRKKDPIKPDPRLENILNEFIKD